jgi:hypothetical protein
LTAHPGPRKQMATTDRLSIEFCNLSRVRPGALKSAHQKGPTAW